MSVYKLFKLARKFELKLSLGTGAKVFDIPVFRKDMKEQVERIVKAFTHPECKEFVVSFPALAADVSPDIDKFIKQDKEDAQSFFADRESRSLPPEAQPFKPSSAQAVKDMMTVRSAALYLLNNIDGMEASDIVRPSLEIIELINNQASKSGLDTFGTNQPNWLDVIYAYTNMYTTLGTYGDPRKLNAMAKRNLRAKIGRMTNQLDYVGDAARKMARLLQKASDQNFFTQKLENLVKETGGVTEDTSRSIKDLEDHEISHLMQITGLAPGGQELMYWARFIKPYPEMALEVRKMWNNPLFKKLWKHSYLEMDKEAALSNHTIRGRIDRLREHIAEVKPKAMYEDKRKEESLLGGAEPSSTVLPEKAKRPAIEVINSNLSGGKKSFIMKHGILIPLVNAASKGLIDIDEAVETLNELDLGEFDTMPSEQIRTTILSLLGL